MKVVQLVCRQLPAVVGDAGNWRVMPCTRSGDRAAVARLAAACRAASPAAGFVPAAGGLIAGLADVGACLPPHETVRPDGRDARSVAAWMARAIPGDRSEDPAGLVSLVHAARGEKPGRWSINAVLVHPHARRRGLGRLLVATALAHAKAEEAGEVWVETSSDWSDARAFWRAAGFEPAS